MSTNHFTLLVLVCLPIGVYVILLISRLEKRLGGSGSLSGYLLLLLLGGVLYIFYLDDAMVSDRREESVRQQFRLSNDVSLGPISGGEKTPVCHRTSVRHRAIARFTPEQFASYVASLDDRAKWAPLLPLHYHADKSRFTFSDDALTWRELPEPGYYGRQRLVWKIAGEDVRSGRAICYDITRVSAKPEPRNRDGVREYVVTSCDARLRTNPPAGGGRVAAALDYDKLRLNIAIEFDSKPDYCNNRVTKWLNETLVFGAR